MDRVGELQMADLITEINGLPLTNLSNEQAMNIYENAVKKDIIRLKRTRSHTFLKDQIKIPTMDKIPKPEVPEDLLRSKEAPRPVPAIQVAEPQEAAIEGAKKKILKIFPWARVESSGIVFQIFSIIPENGRTMSLATFLCHRRILNPFKHL